MKDETRRFWVKGLVMGNSCVKTYWEKGVRGNVKSKHEYNWYRTDLIRNLSRTDLFKKIYQEPI